MKRHLWLLDEPEMSFDPEHTVRHPGVVFLLVAFGFAASPSAVA
jgi:hypothetical protein